MGGLNSYIAIVLHKNKQQFEGEDLKVFGKREIIHSKLEICSLEISRSTASGKVKLA